jgi:hypothetical protein
MRSKEVADRWREDDSASTYRRRMTGRRPRPVQSREIQDLEDIRSAVGCQQDPAGCRAVTW